MNSLKAAFKGLGIAIALFFAISAQAQPDLAFTLTPSGWSAPVVISTNSSSTLDATNNLTTTSSLYVSWAVKNQGNATANNVLVEIYIDGVAFQEFGGGFNVPAGSAGDVPVFPIGSLSAGLHTISVTAGLNNTVAPTNSSDNTYSKVISIAAIAAPPAPTLTAPITGSTGQSENPTFSWTTVTGATSYRILVATNPADLPTSPSIGYGGSSTVLNATNIGTSYTPIVPVNPNTTYYWEVHALINNADVGTWSSISNFTTAVSPAGLTIVPTFDSTITSDSQAATIESTITAALAVYQRNFSNPVTVNITFKEEGTGLGNSSFSGFFYSYSQYISALTTHATTADDSTALAHLPNTANNPANGSSQILICNPLGRALGLTASAGQDGTVFLNTAIMNLSQATNDPNKYALFSVVSHEVDEVLAFGTALNGLANGARTPTGAIQPEDLFRYDGSGNRSFNTTVTTTCYFSLDGITDLAQYNQEQGGDFSDWYSFFGDEIPQVQDAYSLPGVTPVLGVELRALDAVGYSPTHPLAQFAIVASAGSGGSISPSGTINRTIGDNQSFTAAPNAGDFISQWLVDSVAVQTGGTNYILSNIQATHTVQVTFLAKTNQTITFGTLPSRAIGEPSFLLLATASSGLPVSFSILSGPAILSGTNLTITGTGTVTVQATQAGSTTYSAATPVSQSFIVYSPPRITAVQNGTNFIFAWPTNVIGFSLLSTTNLVPPVTWLPVNPAPVIVNSQYTVTNGTSGALKFFELKK